MVKTFIQAIETHDCFSRLRQVLAVVLIFSMLAPDIAKAMESDADETKVAHSIPPFLKGPSKAGIIISSEDQKPLNTSTISLSHIDDAETHILQFVSQSSDFDEDQSKETSFGSTGSSPEKPQTQSSAISPFIASSVLPSVTQDIPPSSFSPPSLPQSIGSYVDSRSPQDRKPQLPFNHSNHSDQSGDEQTIRTSDPPPIFHPLAIDSDSDEAISLLRKQHHQNKELVSIKQYGSTVQVSISKVGIKAQASLDFVDLGFPSEIFSSSHSNQQPDQVGTKKLEKKPLPRLDNLTLSDRHLPVPPPSSLQAEKQRKLQELKDSLIGEDSETGLFFDPKDIRRANTSPISNHDLPSRSSPKSAIVTERTPLFKNQPSIQHDDHDTDQSEDDEISIEIGHPGNPDDPLHLAPSEEYPQYRSCCGCSSKRPFCHKHTKYTLPNLIQHLEEFSQLAALIRQGPPAHSDDEVVSSSHNSSFEIDSEGSSPLNGSPTKEIRVGAGISLEDTDEESVSSDDTINPLLGLDGPQEEQRLDHLPNANFSQVQLLLVDQDLEREGRISASQIASFWEAFEKLPSAAKAKLKQFMHQIFNDKSTWKQRIGKWILGPGIGVMDAIAMGVVYISSFYYILDNYDGKYVNFIDNLINGSLAYVVVDYIRFSLLPDTVSRNAHLWKKAIGYLSNTNVEKLRLFTTAFLSIFPSLIEPSYLVEAELRGIDYYGYHGVDNQFAIAMIVLCPFLFADSMASNMDILWTAWPGIKENLGEFQATLSHYLCRTAIDFRPTSEAKLIKGGFDKRLKNIAYFFSQASDEDVEAIYSQVFQEPEQTLSNENPDVSTAQQAILAVSRLLSLGEEVVEGPRSPTSLSEKSFDIFKKICIATGSPIRLLVLQNIFATMGSLALSKGASQVFGWGLAPIGFAVQTVLEWKAMGNAYERFIRQEEPQEHTSHPTARGHVNRFAIAQGVLLTLCLLSATLQALGSWDLSSWWLFAAIPFFIPEFAGQAFGFAQTYNDKVATAAINGGHKIGGKCQGKSLCTNCKRDRLKKLAQQSRKDLEEWNPDLMHILTIISDKPSEESAIIEL